VAVRCVCIGNHSFGGSIRLLHGPVGASYGALALILVPAPGLWGPQLRLNTVGTTALWHAQEGATGHGVCPS